MMEEIEQNDSNDLKTIIYDNLPSLQNGNYINLIKRIILELILKKEFYEAFIKIDADDKEALKECQKIEKIIEIVKSHNTYKDETIKEDSIVKNNLIFLRTLSGNIYAKEDLSSIDVSAYSSFKTLLESIENGTFSNVRRLTANNKLTGLSEVKGNGTRVVFDRVCGNTYIIIYIFVKKTTRDNGYSERLTTRSGFYTMQKESIRKTLNEDVINEDKLIYDDLMKSLNEQVKVKRWVQQ